MKYMRLLLKIYKFTISPTLKVLFGGGCKYEQEGKLSCSEYTTFVVEKYGIIKGVTKAFKRFLNCR
jgi:putative component of membrane protein insertase Oxa1/YidC/SpoIIIJ protein YidD